MMEIVIPVIFVVKALLMKVLMLRPSVLLILSKMTNFFRGFVYLPLPFLPPVILAVMASFELPRSSVIAGIVFGALCDLVIPAPFA